MYYLAKSFFRTHMSRWSEKARRVVERKWFLLVILAAMLIMTIGFNLLLRPDRARGVPACFVHYLESIKLHLHLGGYLYAAYF